MTRFRLLIGAVALVLAVGVGGYVAYDQVLSGDSVAPLALSRTSPDATPSDAMASAAAGVSAESAATFDGDVAGTWTVTDGSQAGYRVRERLASLPAESDAVGRTSDVSGSITVERDGTTATVTARSVSIPARAQLVDGTVQVQGSFTFPLAAFNIVAPNVGGFILSIADEGTLEFLVTFARG